MRVTLARRLMVLGVLAAIAGALAAQSGSTGPEAALLSAAERRANEGDLRGALEDYEQLARQFPESPRAADAILRIAEGRLALGDAAAALATVERLVTAYPGAPQAAGGLLLEGRIRSSRPSGLDDLESARKALEKAWLLFPRADYPMLPARSAARVLDGNIALRLGRDQEAMSSFLEVVEREPRSPASADGLIGLGMAFAHAGDWRAAAQSLQEALGIEVAARASTALARRRLALVYRRHLRPATGGGFWERARPLTVQGAALRRPTGVAADDAGRLIVLDAGSDEVLTVAPAGAVESRWTVRAGEKPSWGPDAAVQLAARDSAILLGEANKQFSVPGRDKTLDGIRAVERGPFGRWVVLASRSNGVLSFPPERGSGRPVLRGDGDPADLASDARDQLYILESKGQRVLRVSQHDDARATAARGDWKEAAAVAVDPLGFVHVLDGGHNRIHTYDRSGREVATAGPLLPGNLELRKPEDLAVGGDGRLYVADARAGLLVLE